MRAATGTRVVQAAPAEAKGSSPASGMRWIPGGTFAMGSDDFYPEERPVHRVSVDGFWMDERQGQAIDSSTTHLGFRCIVRPQPEGD